MRQSERRQKIRAAADVATAVRKIKNFKA